MSAVYYEDVSGSVITLILSAIKKQLRLYGAVIPHVSDTACKRMTRNLCS